MRLVHWTTMYPLPGDMHEGHAVQKIVHALRAASDEHQHEVHLFITRIGSLVLRPVSRRFRVAAAALKAGPYEPLLHYVPIPVMPKDMFARWINPFWQRHVLAKYGAEWPCDLLHVHMCNHLSMGAVLAARRKGIPVVLTLRREMDLIRLPAWRRAMLVEAAKMADAVISPSAHLAKKCTDATGRDVQVIPSGTDALFDDPPPADVERQARILFVGGLDENKGGRLVVKAVQEVLGQGRKVELRMAGGGPLRQELEAMAARTGGVKFLGNVPPPEVREEMRQASILCVPSYTETLGLVFIEAMKQGLPIIGRCGTGIDGMGERGTHYEVIDKDEDLPGLLLSLLDDDARRQRIAQAGQALASGWTWENAAVEHLKLYERLVKDSGARIHCGE